MGGQKRTRSVLAVLAVLAVLVGATGVVVGVVSPGSMPPALAALVAVTGLMPLALLASRLPDRRRPVAVCHVGVGVIVGAWGVGLASRHGFLELRLAAIGWRSVATSGVGLAPLGLVATGSALMLCGAALLTRRRGLGVLGGVLVTASSCYFTVSLVVVPHVYARRHSIAIPLDWSRVCVGAVLLLAAMLVLVAALGRPVMRWTGPDRAAGSRSRPRARPALWSACGLALLSGAALWGWLTLAPRTPLSEVFPDPNLAACVAREMGVDRPTAKVSEKALAGVLSQSCNGDRAPEPGGDSTNRGSALEGRRIASLRGIDALHNLTTLGLANNDVAELAPLAGLEELATVKLTNNHVADLGPLAALPVLSDLGASGNRITDLTALGKVTTLRSLGLSRNQVTDLGPLANLTGLTTLELSENRVSDVAPLSRLTELDRLALRGNRVGDPAPLGRLPALTMVDITGNKVTDAASFAGFPALEELWVGGNPLTDLRPLAELPSLHGVDLEGSDGSTVAGVDDLRARGIYVGGLA